MTSSKPTAIIFGGVNTFSRALAQFLIPLDGEPLVSHLRIVDKYSVAPATCYLGAEFPKVLEKPEVEYRQANLTVPSIVEGCFNPLEGQEPFSYVFDLTGEARNDRPEEVQIANTFNIARHIGLEAAKRNIKAYVRIHIPCYNTAEKGGQTEKDDIKPIAPGGIWWHETLRALASIPDLNLVILRVGYVYGPYIDYGLFTAAICVAACYGYTKQPMKSMHSPGKHAFNTAHIDDVVGAAWGCAEWMSKLGRQEADTVAGEPLLFHNDKSKIKALEGACAPDAKPVAPVFNLVDDSNHTFMSWLGVPTSLFGTTIEHFDLFTRAMAKINMDELAEDINEDHVGTWTEMITTSKPPVPNTPLSPYIHPQVVGLFEKQSIGLDNSKIKKTVGYTLKRPTYGIDELKEVIEKWKAEQNWPILDESTE
ncbi:hypothetical protein NEOLEDRAFT_1177498 [Neolentinus lepideus HHB14362 ss-1]|uniref:NAD(P)-binding protein n=1 Tax=Neolentinus lepideus HHB14362 ss-1 TaxID=1314782 RepID=A0A165TD88_9AGAM|nr:hypothetical protein NEOLEDRAFT_1177498 [Neolentinus lepideus HHB14362 ss-1]